MDTSPYLDATAVRAFFAPGGTWAKEAGQRIKRRRNELGLTLEQLAGLCSTTAQTLSTIEQGDLVPRDYLRASIAYALCESIDDIWRTLSRSRIAEVAAA